MSTNPLPREIADGIFWMGDCLAVTYRGRPLHGYNSNFLLLGDDCSMLIETGNPKDSFELERQLEILLARGVPELRYIFATHTETPHAGGLGRLLGRFPDVEYYGDRLDMHLVLPQFVDRFHPMDPGDSLDLGGTSFVAIESVIRDMPYTRWGFDTARKVLFPSDGFAYNHYHEDGHCGLLAEEAPSLDIPDMTALFAELALYWTRFHDIEPFLERLERLIFDELEVELIAPTHGLPITDLRATLPKIHEGFRLGATGELGGPVR